MDKKSERARVLKERNALSPTKRAELNSALCRFLGSFLDTVEVQTIGAFPVSYTHLTLPTKA